ncbi:MAG: glycosyltransferase [Beijerinckiaceae bacterium]|nr:glycosyltransferase [Beijerinckiaceae bacterium]
MDSFEGGVLADHASPVHPGVWLPIPADDAPFRSKASPQRVSRELLVAALGRILAKRQEQLDRLPPSVRFLWRHGAPIARLEAAHRRALALGVEARDVLIASGFVGESAYLDRLAEETGCRRVTMGETLDTAEPLALVLDHDMARCFGDGGRGTIVVPTIGMVDWLLAGNGCSGLRLATRAEFEALLLRERRKAMLDEACGLRLARQGHRSAKTGLSSRQAFGGLLLAAACAGMAFAGTLPLLLLALSAVFIAGNGLQGAALLRHRTKPRPMAALQDAELPVYTVLVALYDETAIVSDLLEALKAIDYPPEKLDIKLVLEAHDLKTRKAIEGADLPAQFSVIVCPPGDIRTKPRALNIALMLARGTLVTVFDAEDAPNPNQLRLAAARFAVAPEHVGCLQAPLTLYNANEGLIQAMFALEYAALFDVTRSGWSSLGLPMPLGGTSNHFRLQTLAGLGGWDAHNVTEDAELGLRLGTLGYAIEMLPSETAEQAPTSFPIWFRQRRRWSKGWLQTTITLLHDPVAAIRRRGAKRFGLSVFIMGSTLLNLLFYPVGMAMVLHRLILGEPLFGGSALERASDGAAILVIALGIGVAYATALLAIVKRDLKRGLVCLPLIPVYYLAISAASWIALVDFLRKPFEWLKTDHRANRKADTPYPKSGTSNGDVATPPVPVAPPYRRLFARNRYSELKPPYRRTARSHSATKARS